MALFFFISGYFLPRSLDKKGYKQLIKNRLVYLGIPVLFAYFVLGPITYLIANTFVYKSESFVYEFQPLHLWFIQTLLLFNFGYILIRYFKEKYASNFNLTISLSHKSLLLLIMILSIFTFSVRIFFPVGVSILGMQFGYFTHYTVLFTLGILSYRNNTLDQLQNFNTRAWKYISLITVFILLPIVLIGALDTGFDIYLGGISIQSFQYSVWESLACVSISIVLLKLFHNKFNSQSSLMKNMSKSSYVAYIFHATIIIAFSIPLLSLEIGSPVKFLVVSFFGVMLVYTISFYIIQPIIKVSNKTISKIKLEKK